MAIACEFEPKKCSLEYKTNIWDIGNIPNRLLEYFLKSKYMVDTLLSKTFIRAAEQNFRSEFSLSNDSFWIGYRIKNRRSSCKKFVIVVRRERIPQTKDETLPSTYCGLEVLVKGKFDTDGESRAIMQEEAKYKLDEHLTINDSIIDQLLQAHSNITGITTSPVLSMNYNGDKPHKLKPISCIVILCHTKGVVPMGEKPFPTYIHGFPVDVRESCPATSATRPPHVGDTIKADTGMTKGTLGGFVFIGSKKVYYLTAAHVLVQKHFLNENLFNRPNEIDTKILRKVSQEWQECGKLERGYFGHIVWRNRVTVDAILVSVDHDDHKPKDTCTFLPQENVINAGFSEGSKPYFTGKIKEILKLDTSLDIVKYGQKTLWTKGKMTSFNAFNKIYFEANDPGEYFYRNYYGQIVVTSNSGKFADQGDSGSLVFTVEDYQDPELQCIGLLNAVNLSTFEVFITPIRAVLESLKLDLNAFTRLDPPFYLKYFNIIQETQALQTEILFNIEENTREFRTSNLRNAPVSSMQ
ncbi:uncharacterized protein LOC134230683 [Saccostrea cucullata]|uniref:uncharacterized protein LOC134230683 n=1 Tax=Saccostrea cuccullata TaxID=36930 RepID=UPI002ED3CB4E